MGPKHIRVLLIEGGPAGAVLLREALADDRWATYTFTAVQHLGEGLALLSDPGHTPFDVAVVDLGLPDGQGLPAFQQLEAFAPDLPVVVLSGPEAEELALYAVQKGADDYLVKNPAGWHAAGRALRNAVERRRLQRVLSDDIAERRRAEAALRESEDLFRSFFANAWEAMLVTTPDGGILAANPAACEMFGGTEQELVAAGRAALTDASDPRLLAAIAERSATGMVHAEFTMVRRDGSKFEGEMTSAVYQAADGTSKTGMILRDISERKRADAALRASEEKYRVLMESLDSVVATVDCTGKFLYVNQRAAQQLGRPAGELTGKTLQDVFPEPAASGLLARLRTVIAEDRTLETVQEFGLQGQPGWYRTRAQPVHDRDGRAVAVLVNSTDIHELKAAQQALEELNRTLEARVAERTAEVQDLYDNAPVGYHSLDAQGAIVRVNQTELDWLGYTREEMVGRPVTDFISPAALPAFQKNFPLFRRRGWVKDVDLEFVRKDGTLMSVLASATAVHDAAGNYVMSRTTLFDSTARKQYEEALRESEEQARLLFESSPDAVVLVDETHRIVRVNHALEVMTGYPGAQLIGRTPGEIGLDTPEQAQENNARLVRELEQSNPVEAVLPLKTAGGEVLDVSLRIFRLILAGRPRYLATVRDVTAAKHAAEALVRANEEMAKAVRAKDEFLANMSHELRTPLSAILMLSESLLEQLRGPLNERQQEWVRIIESSGRHLLDMINDILDLAKVEGNRLDLNLETLEIADICQASLLFVRQAAHKKKVALNFRLECLGAEMSADPKRLKQMLVNLLSNAVKFTPSGGSVTLAVSLDEEAGLVRFAVVDTGIGIAAGDLARLFKPFTQLDAGLTRAQEGTGLGLALTQRLAGLHGGAVSVASEPGKGSCFTIDLPYLRFDVETGGPASDPAVAREIAEERAEPVQPGASKRRILLVEDSDINIEVITAYLEGSGYEVRLARDGQEALNVAASVQPDAILMDVQMPVMDGLEATRRLRALPEFRATPVIALTALAMPGDRERCLAAGANAYLSKPVRGKVLVETVKELLSPART